METKAETIAMERNPIPVDAQTALYCVLGDPVAHSMSPVMHNRGFAHIGHNAVYLAFRVTDIGAAVAGLRALGISGASITIPHKVSVMPFLDEIDEAAVRIGAVNTITRQGDRLLGSNSDWHGAVQALEQATEIKGRRVSVIGAGGAARAVVFGISGSGGRVTVVNRSVEKGEGLAQEFNAGFVPLNEFSGTDCDILINTTPVGMAPRVQTAPVPSDVLRPGMIVMDIIYHPLQTKLLETAASAGCVTIDGLEMFVGQGAAQFERWTQQPAPLSVMRAGVMEILGGPAAPSKRKKYP